MRSAVALLRTRPETVVEDYGRLMRLVKYDEILPRDQDLILKLNAIFPEGIEIPAMYVGKNVMHVPTVKCVHPDTEILLSDGSVVRAEALVKEWQVREPARELPDGDRVSEGEVRVISLSGGS